MMSLRSIINNIKNSSNGFDKKQKMLSDQYGEKKSFDIEIQEVKHKINWSRDLFYI